MHTEIIRKKTRLYLKKCSFESCENTDIDIGEDEFDECLKCQDVFCTDHLNPCKRCHDCDGSLWCPDCKANNVCKTCLPRKRIDKEIIDQRTLVDSFTLYLGKKNKITQSQ